MMQAAVDRRSGVLLHPTSLPGPHGIGDLGPGAEDWIGWLSAAGCRLWQILPLVPTGLGNSPYNGSSAFAGNPMLISLDLLVEDGLLGPDDLSPTPDSTERSVDYIGAQAYKEARLKLAADRFQAGQAEHLKADYEAFCSSNDNWLEDYSLFRALKSMHGEAAWSSWDPQFSARDSVSFEQLDEPWQEAALRHRFYQFAVHRQWIRLRQRAAQAGISIIGDLPIFVAHDSSDVWAHRDLFQLDDHGNPTVVAGVPPDYFAATGQRWGNPLYDWPVLEAQGFSWWIERVRASLEQADFVRLDHFRGFEAYWEIPRDAPTAATGEWIKAPGSDLFRALQNEFGPLRFVAEDLGVITPEVISLRDQFDLPGMRIMQFGLEGGRDHTDLPSNYSKRCVAYTGTHDNDTSSGWYAASDESVRAFTREYLDVADRPEEIALAMVEALWSSIANWTIAPLQDLLRLDGSARMNFPGTIEGNWIWRVARDQLTEDLADQVRALNAQHDR